MTDDAAAQMDRIRQYVLMIQLPCNQTAERL